MLVRTRNNDIFNSFFGDFFDRPATVRTESFSPRTDIQETVSDFIIAVDAPGMKAEDFDISIDKGIISISGDRKEEVSDVTPTFHRVERRWGSFERRFRLSDVCDGENISASYDAGVLTVTIPKTEKALPRQIKVKALKGK